jgi:hypothetical protein
MTTTECPECGLAPDFWDVTIYACMVCQENHGYSSCCGASAPCNL